MKIGTSRRSFLALTGVATLAAPLRAFAQQPQLKRVGFMFPLQETDPDSIRYSQALRRGLAKQGWVEPKVSIETRWGGIGAEALQQNAAALIKLQPDVFVAVNQANTLALQAVNASPIVFALGTDPRSVGIVNNAHPGGNITGVGAGDGGSIAGKWFSVLKELSPRIETAGLLALRSQQTVFWPYFASAAQAESVKPVPLEYQGIGDVLALLQSLAALPSPGLVVPSDLALVDARALVTAQVARLKIPTVWGHALFAQDGLVVYRTSLNGLLEYMEDAGEYAGLILNGTKPGDLPVQFANNFSLIVNLKAAREQGIEVPPAMVVRAEEVIQ